MSNNSQRLDAIRGLNPLPLSEQGRYDIRDLKLGGYVGYEGNTWLVKNLFRYLDVKWSNFQKRKRDYWVTELELFCLETGETIFVEWEFDDELELCRTISNVKLRDIKFNGSPIRRDDLEYIADEEEGSVHYNGTTYHYSEDDTWAALFFKSGESADATGAPVRVYEFEASNNTYLSIEAWHDEEDERPEREAFISRSESARAFTILQLEAVA